MCSFVTFLVSLPTCSFLGLGVGLLSLLGLLGDLDLDLRAPAPRGLLRSLSVDFFRSCWLRSLLTGDDDDEESELDPSLLDELLCDAER